MPVPIQTTKQITPLRRAFGLFGGLRLKLDETVVPVAIVEDLVPDEWSDAFAGDARGGPGAGNRNIWALTNPAASGKVMELYELILSNGSACVWTITVIATPYVPGTTLEKNWQDLNGIYHPTGSLFRVPSQYPIARFHIAQANAAITGQTVFTATVGAADPLFYRPRVVLNAGQSIVIWQTTLNVSGELSLQWRERALLPTDR